MPSKNKVTYGPTIKKRAKRLLEALLAYVNSELKDVDGISLSYRWQDETTKQPKLVIETKLRMLETLTDKDFYEGKLTKTHISQALNEYFKDFLHILEDHRTQTQGKEEWHFTLKLWSKETQTNLKQFESEWERHRPKKSKQQEETLRESVVETFDETRTPEDEAPNWREICQRNLAQQKELTTNPFTNAYGIAPKLDKVYVPLAIVERKPPKPKSENQPEEQEQETLIFITKNRFFEEVLRQGKSEISQGRKIAIIGEPGSGKTTRLQKIADWILEKDLGLPIWVSLADLSQATVYQYLQETWLKQTGENLTIDALKQEKKRIWLLLDGIDEMTSKIESRHVSALLGGWLQDARVVMTCRVNVWEADKNAFSGFDVFKNLEFSREQVNQYIGNWFQEIGDAATGKSLEKELAKSENLAFNRLIQNPLRLWMLCQIWQTEGGLLDTQAELYRQFVEQVYIWNQHEKTLKKYAKLCGITQRECKNNLHKALGELAKANIDKKSSNSLLSYQLVDEYLGDEKEETSLLSLALSIGWLNRAGLDYSQIQKSAYRFWHKTFQEYFAALAVDESVDYWDYFLPRNHVNFPVAGKEYSENLSFPRRQDENLSFPRRRESTVPERKPQYRIFQPQWKQVILFWLGRGNVEDKEKEEFIEKLVNFDDGCGEWNFETAGRGFYEYRAYFLAAAGISEFKTCSRCDAIVNQIVKWGFGYYNQDKETWVEFLDPIEKSAWEILPQTDRKRAIRELGQILEHPQCDQYTRCHAAINLGKIDHETAISALIRILETTDNEDICLQAVICLEEIIQGNEAEIAANETAISALVRILETADNEDTRWQATNSLQYVGKGNEKAISALVRILETTDNEDIRLQTADSLGYIDPGNEKAISALVRILETTNEDTRLQAADSLGYVGKGNEKAISALVRVLETTEDEYTRSRAASSLGEIDPGNQRAIVELVRIIESTENEDIRRWAAWSLELIGQGNETAIAELLRVLETTDNEDTRMWAAWSLGYIGKDNETAIAELLRVLETTDNEDTRMWAAWSLGYIGKDNETAIAELLRVLETTDNEDTRLKAVWSLGYVLETTEHELTELTRWRAADNLEQIDPGNQTEISVLIKLLEFTEHESTRWKTVSDLGKIIITDENRKYVVAALQPHLNDETYENNSDLYQNSYRVLWKIAQDLPYPDFYHAWPGLTENSTLVQNLELAQLPRNLQTQLSETNLNQTVQVFYIDGSKFIGDDPAKTIYRQMTQQGGRKIEDKPKNMADLQDYWADLIDENDQPPVLIFYQDPSNGTAQGFSETFLDLLTRFDGIICLITDQTHPPLQTFSPQYPQLIHNIVAWLQRRILEM